ncbi:MAG: DUF4198 domain-containing protein [Pseudomonadota bacterium]
MTQLAARLALMFCLGALLPAQAHEFWINPAPTPLKTGEAARLTLEVGEFFTGEKLPFVSAQTVALRLYSAAGVRDLAPLLTLRPSLPELALPLALPGTHMVIFDSQPNMIVLSADKFHAYLHEEGLDFIKTRREGAGTANKPGRERYRRYVKTLIRVDAAGAPDAVTPAPSTAAAEDLTYAVKTGQRLEVLPLSNPLTMAPGDALPVQILFEGQPLAGALVKAWYKNGEQKNGGQTLTIRATTSADGKATINLPFAGAWTVSVVHMVAATGVKGIDWDSLWGNLSFSVPPGPAR